MPLFKGINIWGVSTNEKDKGQFQGCMLFEQSWATRSLFRQPLGAAVDQREKSSPLRRSVEQFLPALSKTLISDAVFKHLAK